jgi:damage-control phosphatase, subfamily III
LWGNATDFTQQIQKPQKNIIVNDIDAAYGVLRDAWKWGKEDGERHIDIVLGDSGFELFADIVLACYLLSAGLATNVVLHSKAQLCHLSMIHGDISCLFNALSDPQNA